MMSNFYDENENLCHFKVEQCKDEIRNSTATLLIHSFSEGANMSWLDES